MKKLQGGTLFYALAISVIAGLLMSAVLAAEFYHRMLLRNDLLKLEVIRNSESGIVYGCTHEITENAEIDLFGHGKDSVFLQQKMWGAYDVIISGAHTGGHSSDRIAMTGHVPDQSQNYALWLADMDRSLSVTGTTLLKGTCYLPRAGVERAYVEGRSFSGRELVSGSTELSSRFIPAYDEKRLEEMQRLLKAGWMETDSLVNWNDVEVTEVRRSFKDFPLILSSAEKIVISNCNLSGQIIIYSALSIFVDETALLENVILIAPDITIGMRTNGAFQAFAFDSICVEKNVELGYPSVLAIVPDKKSVQLPAIFFGEDSEIEGSVFLACDETDVRRHGSITIGKNSIVEGDLISYGSIDLKGTVKGSVTCSRFILKTNSAIYDNHLMDAVINSDARNSSWLGCLLIRGEGSENVIQWLN